MENISKAGKLYMWVLSGIFLGGLIGYYNPSLGVSLEPLGNGFIALIRMLISPIIFCTIVLGISGAGGLNKTGKIAGRALIYFEVISTLALIIGLVVVNVVQPGKGYPQEKLVREPQATIISLTDKPTSGEAILARARVVEAKHNAAIDQVAHYSEEAKHQSVIQYVLHIIPSTFADAFTGHGDLLQIVLIAILFGVALNNAGAQGQLIHQTLESSSKVFVGMMNLIMKLAPLGAGGAMAFTIGKYGPEAITYSLRLMGTYYLTCGIFIFGVLGTVTAVSGFSILRYLNYIREELLTVLGTSSSETVIIPLMEKLERLGCPKSIVGLVVPTGYSMNLDGTNIYMTLAALFVAQAYGIELSLSKQIYLLVVAMLASKGASGITGAGFITLAATLSVVPDVPVTGLAIIFGVDRFMSEGRAITNTIGNGIASIVISKWQGELDTTKLQSELKKGPSLST